MAETRSAGSRTGLGAAIPAAMMTVGGREVEVVRKAVKRLTVSVGPPGGGVRVTAPEHVRDETVRLAVVARLPWIDRQQSRFEAQDRQSEREYVSGESHYFLGRRYRLSVAERSSRPGVEVRGVTYLDLFVRPGSSREERERVLLGWYRRELKARIPGIVERWEPRLGVDVAAWGVKRMKTLWGSCSVRGRRIWINLELIKKPEACLEYVVVHEMTHLLERTHSERFRGLLTRFLPGWERLRDDLNRAPLGFSDWPESREGI